MRKSTPIIIVEDDPDDRELMQSILTDLGIESELKMFSLADDAYEYLQATEDVPFIIFCDVNLPRTDGVQLKERIDGNPVLRKKSIPFIFLTTTTSQRDVNHVYGNLSIQGFFQKPVGYKEAKELVKMILHYWYHCKHPNSFDNSIF